MTPLVGPRFLYQTWEMLPSIFVWMLLVTLGIGQDLTPSNLWKEPTITLSKDDRIAIASAALEKAVSMLQPDGQFNDSAYDTPGRLYGQMAEFDRLMNQTKYKQTLQQCFSLAESISPGFSSILLPNYVLHYGYAAARAYTAYQDREFLDFAVTSWTTARKYTISDRQAALGAMDVKEFDLSLSCQGKSLVGGTYRSTDSNDTSLNSVASGLFLVVLALLAEATSNKTYLDAAIQSANFIQSHILNPSYVILDSLSSQSDDYAFESISSQSNESCSVYSTTYSSDGSGIFIEGLVILADITRNASTEVLLRSIVAATATDTLWQGLDGVISTTTTGGHYIVRALAALYERNMSSSDLRKYIKEYISVQYNSVIEKATSGGSNMYAIPWTGPPSTSFDSYHQTVAVTALLGGIQLVDDEASLKSSSTTTSSSLPTTTVTKLPSSPKNTLTGATVGGIIGSLAFLAATIVCILLYRRRCHQGNNRPLVANAHCCVPHTPSTAMSAQAEVLPDQEMNLAKSTGCQVGVSGEGEPSVSLETMELDVIRMDVESGESATPEGGAVSPLRTARRGDIPTEELLRLLHERWEQNRWNDLDDELPPEYHESM